nr:MAG TPA: hypothetical protein [Caudoviricetes sp.]
MSGLGRTEDHLGSRWSLYSATGIFKTLRLHSGKSLR